MEIVLAIVVVGAVLFFGALITAGNERQRRAIDELREEASLWAIQDLQIKREHLARSVKVDDPLGWLNRVAANACGSDLGLQVVESFENPPTLLCTSGKGGGTVLFSTMGPDEIRKMKRARSNPLFHFAGRNPLASLPAKASSYPSSVLNAGMLFDLELPLAWKQLANQDLDRTQRLWMYVL
jgi:hypothetical protein